MEDGKPRGNMLSLYTSLEMVTLVGLEPTFDVLETVALPIML